jgi:hypothetical protein
MGGGQKLLARAPLPLLFSVFFLKEIFRCCSKGRERFFFFFAPGHSFGRSRGPGNIVSLRYSYYTSSTKALRQLAPEGSEQM